MAIIWACIPLANTILFASPNCTIDRRRREGTYDKRVMLKETILAISFNDDMCRSE